MVDDLKFDWVESFQGISYLTPHILFNINGLAIWHRLEY